MKTEKIIGPPIEFQKTLDWLIQTDEFKAARELALAMARQMPDNHPQTSDFLAMVLHKTKFYSEALQYAQKTVSLIPDSVEALYNLARCLASAGDVRQAELEIDKVIAARPTWCDPQLDRTVYLCNQGRVDEAEQVLNQLLQQLPPEDPNLAVVKFNLAWHRIRRGQVKEGMNALSVGRKLRIFGSVARTYPQPKLLPGFSVAGKTILLVGEAGAGDEIINVRFAKTIQERGGKCIWVTGQGMQSLFSRVRGVDKVIQWNDLATQKYDFWAPSMDLFSILGLDQDSLPKEKYLSPHPQFVQKWQSKIPCAGPLKIGLRWQGNPLYEQDLYRSVPFHLLRPFFNLKNCQFYSLQRDTGLEEIQALDPIVDLSQDLQTWEDTAAAISLLDVVVTSCTSIAHLAGALGKKVLLFTPMLSYYVWAPPGEKSIWYPDVKLFRQKKARAWTAEAQEIFEDLKRMAK